MFGTMCKPLHAGKAAQNGLLAVRLAARGFTANHEVLETAQGFATTLAPALAPERALVGLDETLAIRNVLFKYHAACYETHATIEGINRLCRRHAIAPERVRKVHLRVSPGHLAICNIAEPRTGLEGKFSLRFTAALAQGRRLEAKFAGLAAPVLGAARADQLAAIISRLEEVASLREITGLCAPQAGAEARR